MLAKKIFRTSAAGLLFLGTCLAQSAILKGGSQRSPGSTSRANDAGPLYAELFRSVAARRTEPSSEITLSAKEISLFLEATGLSRCTFYPEPFHRIVLAPTRPDGASEHMERQLLYVAIAKAVVRMAKTSKAEPDMRRSTHLLQSVVRFGQHISRQDDDVNERMVGQAVERIGLKALVQHHRRMGHSEAERETSSRLRKATQRGEATVSLIDKIQQGACHYSRVRDFWLKKQEILWRKYALMQLALCLEQKPQKARPADAVSVLRWCAANDPEVTVRKSAENILGYLKEIEGQR